MSEAGGRNGEGPSVGRDDGGMFSAVESRGSRER